MTIGQAVVDPELAAGPGVGQPTLHGKIGAAPFDAVEVGHVQRRERKQAVERACDRDRIGVLGQRRLQRAIIGTIPSAGGDSLAPADIDHWN
ncbi:MAG TPA: hypothetical protein PK857_08565 [Hyphomicrobium sp.]|nr:hypothetical protein [Hyphomicrobium sp.]